MGSVSVCGGFWRLVKIRVLWYIGLPVLNLIPVMSQPIHNRYELKEVRRNLRRKATPAEICLWKLLKGKQLKGVKFRRQHSVGCYVIDFYCATLRLAIELDGAHHFTEGGRKHDEARTQYLNSLNIKVIRFENKLLLEREDFVLEEIGRCLTTLQSSIKI